jgi:peptidoglycan/LPS O-acetylase OafA/YrhL
MAAPQASVGRFYRPELDVVRFLAFLLVFLHHTLPTPGDSRSNHLLMGFAPALSVFSIACKFGLSLFFTLSAFLICELLIREREANGTIGVKQFYIRRILRIWPLYYLALALGVVIAFLPRGNSAEVARLGWFGIFMGAWDSAFYGPVSNPVSPLWSISVEEQFYLFAPWAVKCLNRKLLYGFCVALIILANICLYRLGNASASTSRIWNDSFVQFECFAAGILLCLFLRGWLPEFAVWLRMLVVAGSFSCWLCAAYLETIRYNAFAHTASLPIICTYALTALGSGLFIVAFLGVNPRLLPAWAIYLGRISFGLYVYHEFAIYLSYSIFGHHVSFSSPAYYLKAVLAIGLTFSMAALSYRYFETPFLKMKKRHAVIESQPIEGVD